MITFWIVALLLSLLASAFVLLPMFVSARTTDKEVSGDQARSAINIEIFKQRLGELEASRAELAMTDEGFEQLKVELEQELLSNVQSGQESPAATAAADSGSFRLLIPLVFAAVIPLLAVFFYADWGLSYGSISDVAVARELDQVRETGREAGHTRQEMVGVIQRLRESLSRQPENDEGWMLLARSLVSMGEYEQSADAFKQLLGRYPRDALLRSYYAESLYMADARQITPRVRQAIDATLALDPESPNVLEMLGMEAFVTRDYAAAIGYFERVIAQDVSPELTQMLQEGIAEARSLMGESAAAVPATAASADSQPKQPEGKEATKVISVLVEMDESIPSDGNDTVFVYARATQGPPMPLAIERLTVSDLPRMVRLDDTMSMVANMNILTVGEVQIVARVSKSGAPAAAPGDYQAVSESLTLEAHTTDVKLRISELVK
jgi:cytochrome c-type biogenesis protein CcmH